MYSDLPEQTKRDRNSDPAMHESSSQKRFGDKD